MFKKGPGCLMLFALPFAGVGIGMTVWTAWILLTWSRAQSWVETPATIVKTELLEKSGDDSTSYEAAAEYAYQYAGVEHRSTSVAIHCGNDHVEQDLYRRLKHCQQSGRQYPCFVNAGNPSESLLDRDLRGDMLAIQALAAAVFSSVGGGLILGGIAGLRRKRRQRQLSAAAPETPWLWRDDWAAGVVCAKSGWRVGAACGFALFWNLVSGPLWFVLPNEILVKGNRLALVGLIFPIVGLGLVAWAAKELVRRRKYGVSAFQMAAAPGVVGGQLAGVVRVPARIEPEDGFRVALRCYKLTTVHSSDGESTQRTAIWQTEQVIARSLRQSDPTVTAIPIQMAIPYTCQPTDMADGDGAICWQLEVSAKSPGVDYCAEFEVPVFRTADSREDFQADTSVLADYIAPIDPVQLLRESGVVVTASPEGAGIRMVFARSRHLGMVAFVVLFTIVWSGAIVGMLWLGAPIFFAVMFGFFDLLLLYGCVDLLFYRSVVDAMPKGVRVAAGWFVLGKGRWIDSLDIEQFTVRSSMSSGNTQYFDLSVFCKGGKSIKLGKHICGQQAADLAVAELEKAVTNL